MLARIANNLFWMGRYVERAENMARFIKVHLFSTLDTTTEDKKKYMFKSILTMVGLDEIYEYPEEGITNEPEFFEYLSVDLDNFSSILFSIKCARENARGARDSISTDVWNTMNLFYHGAMEYNKKEFTNEVIYTFCDFIIKNCAIIYSQIETTLLHNEVTNFLKLGIFMERASQTVRIVYSKSLAIEDIIKDGSNPNLITHEYMNMLKCAEAYDMSKKYYRSVPSNDQVLEFLIFNTMFPKSIHYNLNGIIRNLKKLSETKQFSKESLEYKVTRWITLFGYSDLSQIKNLKEFLDETLDEIYKIAFELEQKYM